MTSKSVISRMFLSRWRKDEHSESMVNGQIVKALERKGYV